ncbi:hypothetical protein [Pseudomonas sp. NUPR-001]|uniref:hypothetical protein n=1 Tax=Pseudomonas sp. NUPR-001 TaxID=3416058 RepID=UPI003F9CF291
MTVSTTDSVETYVSGGPAFSIPYRFLNDSDIQAVLVKQDGTSETLVLGTQYTLVGAGSQSGGTLTSSYASGFLATPGASLTISRVMSPVQPTDLRNQGRFLAETHETVFDRLTMLIQQSFSILKRALLRPVGKNYYDAEGRRIANVANPSEQQDAVTKQHMEVYVGTLIGAGTGPINLASNVLYVGPDGITRTVQDMSGVGSVTSGAGLIGYGDANAYAPNTIGGKVKAIDAELDATTLSLQGQIDTLKLTTNKPAIISNSASAIAKNVTVAGDSISHGAFALNIFMHAWVRVFHRMVNADLLASNYGFANWATLGSPGPTTSTEIHNVSFSGSWGGIDVTTVEASYSPIGSALRSPGVGGTMTFGVPFFQNLGEIHYLQQPGGGTFTITVNGVLVATVNANGSLAHAVSTFNLADAGYGSVTIVVEQTVAGIVDIIGPAYNSPGGAPVFNNYSQSGRRARYMSEYIIGKLMAESSTYVFALGHNDQGSADSDNTYFAAFVQVINWHIQYAKQYNVKVVVPDFCWTAPENSRARAELQRLAKETGGIYINLPKMIFSGDVPISTTYLIDVLKMWTDGSHPNKDGHKWIAETIARAMGLSCTSKRDAMRLHDFWMPLPLLGATGVENGNLVSASLSSAYKRNGNEVSVKLFVENAPSGAFPVGAYNLTAAFNAKSELNLAQGTNGVGYMRNDTGAVISGYSITSGGALTLNVYTAFVNDQIFSFASPIAPGTL